MKNSTDHGQQADWLIIFLVLDTIEITNNLDRLLNELSDTRLRPGIKIFFLKDKAERIRRAEKFATYIPELSQLIYSETTGKTEKKPIALPEAGHANSNAWLMALREVYLHNEARFSALVCWSHAAAIALGDGEPPNTTERTGDTENGHSSGPSNKLYVSEIADGLRDLTNKRKFDIIVMANCYSQFLDNCYNLSAITRYYVAPMTLIQLKGYDFAAFIEYLNSTYQKTGLKNRIHYFLKYKTKNSKRQMPHRMYRYYIQGIIDVLLKGYHRVNPAAAASEAIFAHRLDRFPDIKPALNILCRLLIANRHIVYPQLDLALKNDNIRFCENDFADFIVLMNALSARWKDPSFDRSYGQLKQMLAKRVLVTHQTGKYLPTRRYNYFSVFMPMNANHRLDPVFAGQYMDKRYRSAFVHEVRWPRFVLDFWAWRAGKG